MGSKLCNVCFEYFSLCGHLERIRAKKYAMRVRCEYPSCLNPEQGARLRRMPEDVLGDEPSIRMEKIFCNDCDELFIQGERSMAWRSGGMLNRTRCWILSYPSPTESYAV